jgi:methylmalonyl-CoA mutase C-terminal domain/subunit
LGGAHITLGARLIEEARRERLRDTVVFVIGGVFPPEDNATLKDIGFDEVFTPGATRQEIVSCIKRLVSNAVG